MKRLVMIMALTASLSLAAMALASGPVAQLLQQSQAAYEEGKSDKSVILMLEAVEFLWQDAGIWIAQAELLAKPGAGFGIYEPRAGNVYAPGEPILLYVEPMGFKHKKLSDGRYTFGVSVDFMVKAPDGRILAGKKNLKRFTMTSRRPNREFFLNLTYTLTGAPPGDYVLETVLHDLVDGATVSVDNKIIIRQ